MRYMTFVFTAVTGLLFVNIPSPANSAEQYTLAVGSLGGTFGRLGAGLAEIFNKKQDKYQLNVVAGGGRANPARVGAGGADFGFSFSNLTIAARKGNKPYKKAYPNLQMAFKVYQSCFHQYAAKELYDTGIQTWENIVNSKKPLKLSVGKKGTATEYYSQLIVKHLGSSYEKLQERGFKIIFGGAGASSRAIRSRGVDFYFHNSGIPNAAGIQAHLSRPLTFLNMSDNVKKMFLSKDYSTCVIPGGTYKGASEDTHSVGQDTIVLTTGKVKSDVVYTLAKIAHENPKFLGGVHKIFKEWTLEKAAQELGVPKHEGAKRFYKEKGVLK